MDLLTLAQRVEGAAAEEQRELLIDAWDATGRLDPERPGQFAAWLAFERMLDAEAWESASLMLVPEGWDSIDLRRTDDGEWHAELAGNDMHLMAEDPDEFWVEATRCKTGALAIVTAALKARASMETTDER